MWAMSLSSLSERDWQAQVVELAGLCGWMVQHSRPAQIGDRWRDTLAGHVEWYLWRPSDYDEVLARLTRGGAR